MNIRILYKNSLVNNIYYACTLCYDNTKDISYNDKKNYIGKRVSVGHDSILEHGRIAILITDIPISSDTDSEMIELTCQSHSEYLNFYTNPIKDNSYNLIISGSVRGYKHFIDNTIKYDYYDNKLISSIINILSENCVKEFFPNAEEEFNIQFALCEPEFNIQFTSCEPDVILDDVIIATNNSVEISNQKTSNPIDSEYQKFIYEPSSISYQNVIYETIDNVKSTNGENDKSVIVGIDTNEFIRIYTELNKLGFNESLVYDIMPVTVVFRNMSRTATHQLVRHRNAITQESQRYVNAENASFTIPIPEYDSDKQYSINLFNNTVNVNLETLAKELISVYGQLLNQGLKKEEARAYLPSNINCGRLMMTFTLSNMFKFIELRTDSHAQFEIREYANVIDNIINNFINTIGVDILKSIKDNSDIK